VSKKDNEVSESLFFCSLRHKSFRRAFFDKSMSRRRRGVCYCIFESSPSQKKNALDFHSIPILGEFLAYFLTRFDRAFKPERIIRSGGAKSTRNGEEREVV